MRHMSSDIHDNDYLAKSYRNLIFGDHSNRRFKQFTYNDTDQNSPHIASSHDARCELKWGAKAWLKKFYSDARYRRFVHGWGFTVRHPEFDAQFVSKDL